METEQLFIATPTHIIKRYCADKFLNGIFKSASSSDGKNVSKIVIACNSRGSAESYYNAVALRQQNAIAYQYYHLSLPDDFYNQIDSIHRRIVYTMNFLRDRYLNDTNRKYFLSLEADVILNPEALDMMFTYIQKYPVVHSNCYPNFHLHRTPTEVDRMTLGCTMIRREVLEQLSFRYEPERLNGFHDAFFAHDCVKAGHKIIYLPAAEVDHVANTFGQRGWEQLPSCER